MLRSLHMPPPSPPLPCPPPLSQGRQEFTPSPDETKALIKSYYGAGGAGGPSLYRNDSYVG